MKDEEYDGEYFDELLQKMICEVPQLRRLWTWKDGTGETGEILQDNIKLGIVFDLMEHLHKHIIKLQAEDCLRQR